MAMKSSQPTIRERLSDNPLLRAAVRSSSLYSYEYARPGYIERPWNAGGQYMQLARSLAALDKSLIPVLQQHADRTIEEGVARGTQLLAESDLDNPNMRNWKEFTEAHPEHGGYNPWLQKGYEQARLKGLGLDFQKQLNDAFVQSGMVNERDPRKVQDFVEEQAKAFRKDAGLNAYEDKLLLAQHYTGVEATAKQQLYARHSEYLRSQNETLMGQQYTDVAVKMMENLTDPALPGSVNMHDPRQQGKGLAAIQNIVAGQALEAAAHGYRNAKVPELAAGMLLTMYGKTQNPAYLEALEKIEVNGVKLINQPGMAEKIDMLEQRRIQRQRAALQHAWAAQAHNDRMQERALLGQAWEYTLSGKPLTPDTVEELHIPARLRGLFVKHVGDFYSGMQKVAQNSPASRTELGLAYLRAKHGDMSDAEAVSWFSQFGAEGKGVLQAKIAADKEENTLLTTNMKDGANKIFSLFARTKDSLNLDALMFEDPNALSREQQDGIEAAKMFSARYEQEYRRLAAENGGANVTGPQAEALRVKLMGDVAKEASETFNRRDAVRNAQQQQPQSQQQQASSSAQETPPMMPSSPAPAGSRVDPTAYAWVLEHVPGTQGLPPDTTLEELRAALQALAPDRLPAFDAGFGASSSPEK